MKRTSSGWLVLVLSATGGLSACCGTTKTEDGGTPTVAFVSPVDGAILTAANGTAAAGTLTISVTATATDVASGSSATLSVDGTAAGTTTATAKLGLTFSSVALTGSASGTGHTLSILVTDSAGSGSAKAEIHVTVTLASQGVCTVAITPADQTLFNESGATIGGHTTVQDTDLATPGMQANLVVTVSSPCTDGTPVVLNVGTTALPAMNLAGGSVTFTGITLPDTPFTALTDPSQALAVTATAGTGNQTSTVTVHYFVDSVSPAATITAPVTGATLTNAQDVDPNTGGLQVFVTGTTTGFAQELDAGTLVPFTIVDSDGGLYTLGPQGSTNLAGDGTFNVEVTLINGMDTLAFQATTQTGNVATSNQVSVTAAATPTLAFTFPTPNEILTLADDRVPTQPGLQDTLTMTTTATNAITITICSTVAPTPGASSCSGTPLPSFLVGTTPANGNTTSLGLATLGDDGAAPNQTIYATVDDNGQTAQASVTVQVHSLTPVIESIAFSNAYTDAQGRLWLNASTLQGGEANTQVTVTVDAIDSYQFDGGVESVTVTNTTNNTVLGSAPLTFGGANPTAQISLTLPDQGYALAFGVTDDWGNPSSPAQTQPVATSFDLFVKTSLPSCALTSPSSNGYYNIQDNNGVGTDGGVAVPVTVSVANGAGVDPSGSPITGELGLTVNTVAAGSAAVTSGALIISAQAPQGTDLFAGTITDPAGNPVEPCSNGFSLTVNTVGPTVAVIPGADPSGGGIDGGVQTYLGRAVPVTVDTTGVPNGQPLTVSFDGTLSPTLATPQGAGVYTATLQNAPEGAHNVVATVADQSGNVGQGSAPIYVDAPGCDLSVTSPQEIPQAGGGESVTFNAKSGTLAGGVLTANVTLHTSCTGSSITFTSTPTGGSTATTQQTADQNGDATFQLTNLTDGATGTFSATLTGGALPTVGYVVKLSTPTIGAANPSTSSVEIVAAQDNLFVPGDGGTGTTDAGGTIAVNLVNTTTAAYAAFTLTGLSGLGPVDANENIGTATLTQSFAGDSALPIVQSIASGATSVTFGNVALPANSYPQGGTVTITVTDNAGNQVLQTWSVITDVVPPTAPVAAATIADGRKANIQLGWTVPALGSASAIASYELRYVVNPLSGQPLGTLTEAVYAQMTPDPTISQVGAGTPGSQLTHTVSNLPTLNQYAFELRAVDGIGNQSALVAAVNASSVDTGVAHAWQVLTLNGPPTSANADFGYVLRTGDFNKDGKMDLVISSPERRADIPGSVYVLYGSATLAATPTDLADAGMTQLTLGGTVGDYFGFGSDPGDFNGDGYTDLAVGSPEWSNGRGRVDIFFGSATGLSTTPSVTILGDSSQAGQFGHSVTAVGDINKDGIVDSLVGAPTEGPGGSAYLFLGAMTWPASPTPASIISGNPGDALGARQGVAAIGDLNGDGKPDFTIGAPGGGDGGPNAPAGYAGSGTEYGISGAVALANPTLSVNTQPLFAPIGLANTYCDSTFDYAGGFYACFGVAALGGQSFTGGSVPDLIVGSPSASVVNLYTMSSSGPSNPAAFSGTGALGLGYSLGSIDLNEDGIPDLLVGSDPGTSVLDVYFGTGVSPGLPATVSATINGISGSRFGFGVSTGDYTGAGLPCFSVTDPVASYVSIYY